MKKWFLLFALLIAVPTYADATLPFARSSQVVLAQTDEPDAGLDAGMDVADAGVLTPSPVPPALDGDMATAAPLLKAVFDAVMSKNWILAAAFLVSTLVFLARWASKKWGFLPFLATDRGGVILTFLFSFAGGLGNAMVAPGATFNVELLLHCFMVATYAIGGFVGVKKLLFPSDLK